jgi:hypothetical protein
MQLVAVANEAAAAQHERQELLRVHGLEQQLAQVGGGLALHLHVSDPEGQLQQQRQVGRR